MPTDYRIQRIGGTDPVPQVVHVGPSQVEVVSEFISSGACTTHKGSSEFEIRLWIGIARNCVTLLEKHMWKSHVQADTEVSLYRVCVLPVLLYQIQSNANKWAQVFLFANIISMEPAFAYFTWCCSLVSLLLHDVILLTHGLSIKSSGSRISDI